MRYNLARRKYYVEMFNYVWSMDEVDFEQLLIDGASQGLRDNWESYYNAKLLKGMKRKFETRNIFHLLDAKREDFEYALDDYNNGFFD
tara:strand:+ start:235 stop:498 length:264 start_codon:yes stop_codon:yes gene_type:complete